MTTVAVGATGTATLGATSTITVTLDPAEAASVSVKRGSTLLYSQEMHHTQTIGPYLTDDVLSITSNRGTIDYTVDAYTAPQAPADVGFANPMTTAGDLIKAGTSGAAARLAKGSDGQSLKMVAGAVAWSADIASSVTITDTGGYYTGTDVEAALQELGLAPHWVKVTLGFADFSAASTTHAANLSLLAAGAVVHGVKIKHGTAFAGGAISAYTVSVGISGTAAKYATAFDVFQAVSTTTFQLSDNFGSEGPATQLIATATSTDANLSAATAGSVDIWLLLSVAI